MITATAEAGSALPVGFGDLRWRTLGGLGWWSNAASAVGAAFLFAMWLQAALRPDSFMRGYFGEPIETPAGRNQIRAMVGGTNLGLALLLVGGLVWPEHQPEAMIAVGVVGASIGATRLASLGVDRPHTFYNRFDSVVEPLAASVMLALGLMGL